MRNLILLPFALVLLACNPEKKLQRFLDRHPEFRDTVTVTIHDTIVLAADTLYQPIYLRRVDTVKVENERQVIIIRRIPTGSPCDTALFLAHVTGIVKPDTIVREHTRYVDRIGPTRTVEKFPWWGFLVIGLLLAALVGVAFKK